MQLIHYFVDRTFLVGIAAQFSMTFLRTCLVTINYWRKTIQHNSWHAVVLTSTVKSTSLVSLFTFALEGSLGVEALCMEAAPVCICHTFIYIWGEIQTLQ